MVSSSPSAGPPQAAGGVFTGTCGDMQVLSMSLVSQRFLVCSASVERSPVISAFRPSMLGVRGSGHPWHTVVRRVYDPHLLAGF